MPKRSACASLVLACVLVALTPAPGQAPLLVRVRPTVFVVTEEREERQHCGDRERPEQRPTRSPRHRRPGLRAASAAVRSSASK